MVTRAFFYSVEGALRWHDSVRYVEKPQKQVFLEPHLIYMHAQGFIAPHQSVLDTIHP